MKLRRRAVTGDERRTFEPAAAPARGRGRPSSCAGSCRSPARWPSPSVCSSRLQALVAASSGIGGGRSPLSGAVLLVAAGAVAAAAHLAGEVARRGPDPGRRSTRCGARSCGATRWSTRSSRWWPPRGSPTPRPARRCSRCGCGASGAKVGRGVWCETYWLPEADLVRLGDGVSVNRGCVLQTHLFHDRVMSMSTVDLDHGATMGPHGVILPAASIGADATVGPVVPGDARRARPGRHPLGRQPDRTVARRRRRAVMTATPRDGEPDDPYVPERGNGGLRRHGLRARPRLRVTTNLLTGRARITAVATQDLKRLALDLVGLRVQKVAVDGRPARWAHRGGKLQVTPATPIDDGDRLRRRRPLLRQPPPRSARPGARSGWEELDRRRARREPAERRAHLVPLQRPPEPEGAVPRSAVTAASGYHVRRQRRARLRSGAGEPARPGCTSSPSPWRRTWPPCRSAATRRSTWRPSPVAISAVLPPARHAAFEVAFARQAEMMDVFVERFGPYPFEAGYRVVVADDPLEIPLEAQGLSIFGANHLDGAQRAAHRPRARAPVVRQQPHRGAMAGHLAARGLRLLRRVDLVRGLRRPHRPTSTPREHHARLAALPQDLVLGDPGPVGHVRRPRLQAGRPHAPRAAPSRSATGRSSPLLRRWARDHQHGTVTTEDFVALAEREAGRSLGELFDAGSSPAAAAAAHHPSELSERRSTCTRSASRVWTATAASRSVEVEVRQLGARAWSWPVATPAGSVAHPVALTSMSDGSTSSPSAGRLEQRLLAHPPAQQGVGLLRRREPHELGLLVGARAQPPRRPHRPRPGARGRRRRGVGGRGRHDPPGVGQAHPRPGVAGDADRRADRAGRRSGRTAGRGPPRRGPRP